MRPSTWRPILAASLALFLCPGCGDDSSGDEDGGDGVPGADAGPGDPGADAAADYVPPFGGCAGEDESPPPPDDQLCLYEEGDLEAGPVAVIEYEFVTYEGVEAVHIRLVFDPGFADNTYGTGAIGWDRDHKFGDLVGSDHATIVILDQDGQPVFDLDVDYLTQDDEAPCGYSSLGPFGGEGRVNAGDPAAILGWATSISLNLNERGYCEDYLVDSPATDESCTPNPDAPGWDFRVVYELWIALGAFDPVGFGSAYMSGVHASPSKYDTNTVEVDPRTCDDDCSDPDGCGGGECSDADQCEENEFCYDGECVPVVD